MASVSSPNEDRDEPAFAFGKNWQRFIAGMSAQRIEAAEASLKRLLGVQTLQGKRFIDAGSGSGLFSLAAVRLGAVVSSFDADPFSVACTRELQDRFGNEQVSWTVEEGSLLDKSYLSTLGQSEVVYCWGVAHHTGSMWEAIENLTKLVAPGGTLVIAIYNDQQYVSRGWHLIKRIYKTLPSFLRPLFVLAVGAVEFLKRLFVTAVACLIRLATFKNPITPITNWVTETRTRGMSAWHDLVDWVGGWPFEVATPDEIFRFARDRGFVLQELNTCSGHGCNEFVFLRPAK